MDNAEEVFVVRWDKADENDIGFWWALNRHDVETAVLRARKDPALYGIGTMNNLTLWAVPIPSDFLGDRMAVRSWIYQCFERMPIQLSTQDPDAIVYLTLPCGCGYNIVLTPDGWQHDVAPYFWGDDHEPDPGKDVRVITYCRDCDCGLNVQTDADQIPTDADVWADLVENLTEDKVPDAHSYEHTLGHEVVS